MKKKTDHDDVRPEYSPEFFQGMRPNRFAARFKQECIAVVLDADVAEVFTSSESVNTVLRSAIRAMRTAGAKSAKPPSKRRAS